MAPQSTRRAQRALEKTIDEIFALNAGIRFVAIYQDQYMLAGGMRKGAASLDPEDEAIDIDLKLSKTGEIVRSWQKWFGSLDVLLLRYERLNLLYLPISEGRFLVLSTEPTTNPVGVVDSLRRELDIGSIVRKIP